MHCHSLDVVLLVKRIPLVGLFLFMMAIGSTESSAQQSLRLATTTSVQDSGLMPYLLSHFEKRCRCKVHVIAVGSGQALKIASHGDVDMVLVHDPVSEKEFVDNGFGINRKTFMKNDFVILGPVSDPARIFGMKEAHQALAAIKSAAAFFVSRGDASGTHKREQALWAKAGVKPQGSWYLEIGQGMGMVLTVADEKEAYTISDRSTFLARSKKLKLRILVEGGPDLVNYYSAIQVNPVRFPSTHTALARQLIDWLTSPECRDLIESYRVNGHQLFKPVTIP